MEKFKTLQSVMMPLDKVNIDTDQILPARYLQKPRANNFGEYLFKMFVTTVMGHSNPNLC